MDRHLPLYKLDILRAVVQLGGVGAAAESLHVTQPVVTAHIRSLEESVGVKIFARKGRRLELTATGQLVHEWAKESDARTRQLERQLSSLSSEGDPAVVIAAGMSVGSYRLPQMMADFAHDHAVVKLTLDVRGPDEVINSVVTGDSDFGILIADELARDDRLRYQHVGAEELVIVGLAGWGGTDNALTSAELNRLPFVSTPRAHIRRTVEERHLHRLGVEERRVTIELGHPEAMKCALYNGLGIAVMFRCAVETDLRDARLVEYTVDGLTMSEPVIFLTRGDMTLTPGQQRVYNALAEGFRHPLAMRP